MFKKKSSISEELDSLLWEIGVYDKPSGQQIISLFNKQNTGFETEEDLTRAELSIAVRIKTLKSEISFLEKLLPFSYLTKNV